MAERSIDGIEFRVAQLPASQGLELALRAGKILGPIFGALDGKRLTEEGADRNQIALKVLPILVRDVDPKELTAIIIECAEKAQMKVNGQYDDVVFDVHFQGNLLQAFQVAMFVLEVNLGSFFTGSKVSPAARRTLGSQKGS